MESAIGYVPRCARVALPEARRQVRAHPVIMIWLVLARSNCHSLSLPTFETQCTSRTCFDIEMGRVRSFMRREMRLPWGGRNGQDVRVVSDHILEKQSG